MIVMLRGKVTCAVDQRRDGTLLRQHAFHTVGLLGMVKAKDIGFTQTECVTCRERKINTHMDQSEKDQISVHITQVHSSLKM